MTLAKICMYFFSDKNRRVHIGFGDDFFLLKSPVPGDGGGCGGVWGGA